jgi:hypothetical protein
LDDYFRWRLKLSYDQGPFVRTELWLLRLYMRVGGHPARVTATVGMRDGIVWNKGVSVWIETYAHDPEWSGNELFEFSLLATADSVSRFEYFGGSLINPQLKLHSNYVIGRPSGCEICVEGWAKFTPYAEPSDVRRLMNLDLSCLTRWHPCVSQSDILPAAWAQYRAERALEDRARSETACPQSFLEILGRDSVNIATVEILEYHSRLHSEDSQGVAKVRLLRRLKGVSDWNVGEARDVNVNVTMAMGKGRADLIVPALSHVFIFGGRGRANEMWIDLRGSYPVVPVNQATLTLIGHGINQDYSAMDHAD